MATHVLVRNNLVVSVVNGFRPLTATETANSGTRREVNAGVPIIIGGTVTLTGGKVSAISNPNALSTAEDRREQVKAFLRAAEVLPVANWGLVDSARAKNYWRWLEIIGRASKTDGNLTGATEWAEIEDEIEINPAEWYREHHSQWTTTVTNFNTWYGTNSTNWRPKTSAGTMDMSAGWTGGLVEYLHG